MTPATKATPKPASVSALLGTRVRLGIGAGEVFEITATSDAFGAADVRGVRVQPAAVDRPGRLPSFTATAVPADRLLFAGTPGDVLAWVERHRVR